MELRGLVQIIDGASGALSTTAAAVIGVTGAGAITALYLLRLRRRRVTVAFAPLWLGGPGPDRAARRTRRLRHWLSLALALTLFAAILLGAVAVDRQRGTLGQGAFDQGGRSVVVLIDRSTSMSATDEAGSRLAVARRRADEIIGGL